MKTLHKLIDIISWCLCPSLLIIIGRRALGQAAKLRCGGSNPPGASKQSLLDPDPLRLFLATG
jgi:hypothetical protein